MEHLNVRILASTSVPFRPTTLLMPILSLVETKWITVRWSPPLQRHNIGNSKRIFPEKDLSGHSPNFYIHVSVSDLYIPTIKLPSVFCCRKIGRPILGIYKSLTDTWMWTSDIGHAIPRKGIHNWDFRYSVSASDKATIRTLPPANIDAWQIRRKTTVWSSSLPY
jgi:hypothetical protein